MTKNINNWHEVYNIGSRNSYTLIELSNTILDVAQEKYAKQRSMTFEQNGIFYNSSLNCSMFYENFRRSQKYSIRQSVVDIMDYAYKQGRNSMQNG